MSWLLACLPIYCVQRAIFPPHASQRPHSKVDQGTPHLSFSTMQWKQTLSSASNKGQPVVAAWAADQARPQVQDLRRKKKKKKPARAVFLAANQTSDALVSGTREGKVVKGNVILPHMQGVSREEEQRQPLLQQKSWWGFKHYLMNKQTPKTREKYVLASHIYWHTSTGETRTHVHVSTHSQSEKCADNWGALSSGLERREPGQSLSLCLSWEVARRSCGAKRETVEFLSSPMGHAAKCENHKYLASSNRFRILCYVKTKTAVFVGMSAQCIYFCISNFKLDITATFSYVYVMTTTYCETFFALKNVLFCILMKQSKITFKKLHDWWFCGYCLPVDTACVNILGELIWDFFFFFFNAPWWTNIWQLAANEEAISLVSQVHLTVSWEIIALDYTTQLQAQYNFKVERHTGMSSRIQC